MTRKPGRLYRALHAAGAPADLFTVTTDDGTYGDDQVRAITATRGSRNTVTGLSPSTATVDVAGDLPAAYDSALTVDLANDMATWVALHTGTTALDVQRRWTGRIGKQTVSDPGPETPHRTTKIEAAHWAAQAPLAKATGRVTLRNPHLWTLYQDAWAATGLPGRLTRGDNTPMWDRLQLYGDSLLTDIPIDDVWRTYADEIGIVWRTLRDGTLDVRTTPDLQLAAIVHADRYPEPVTRRRVLSPATWEQPATSPGQIIYQRRAPADPQTTLTVTVTVYNAETGVTRPIRAAEIDTRAIWDRNQDPASPITQSMLARANRAAGLWFNVPTVTVDMIHLLTSESVGERYLAGQLLTREHFDPVALTNDWPADVQGVTLAPQITENITPDSWTITLGLQRLEYITGQHTHDIYVPGVTWDTAYNLPVQWDMATNRWDTAPSYDLPQ